MRRVWLVAMVSVLLMGVVPVRAGRREGVDEAWIRAVKAGDVDAVVALRAGRILSP
jgi:hypothetical protein